MSLAIFAIVLALDNRHKWRSFLRRSLLNSGKSAWLPFGESDIGIKVPTFIFDGFYLEFHANLLGYTSKRSQQSFPY